MQINEADALGLKAKDINIFYFYFHFTVKNMLKKQNKLNTFLGFISHKKIQDLLKLDYESKMVAF